MTKRKLAAALILLALLLPSCAEDAPPDGTAGSTENSEPEYFTAEDEAAWLPAPELTALDGLTLTLEQDIYPVGVEEIRYSVYNGTENTFLLGWPVELYKLVNGQWLRVPQRPGSYAGVADPFGAGETDERELSLTKMYEKPLAPGEYILCRHGFTDWNDFEARAAEPTVYDAYAYFTVE
ncbi:MAG: hypothetical protein IJB19_07360 [Clostridia bacterium]|nr:hypothetical protein [Clostridia bacterium]